MSVLTSTSRLGRTATVVATVVTATVINLLIYVVGWALGATYAFTSNGGPTRVDALTLTGFTAVPLLVGMAAAAVLSWWWRWVIPAALVVAPVLAIGPVPFMPLAVDFDPASAVALVRRTWWRARWLPWVSRGCGRPRRLPPSRWWRHDG